MTILIILQYSPLDVQHSKINQWFIIALQVPFCTESRLKINKKWSSSVVVESVFDQIEIIETWLVAYVYTKCIWTTTNNYYYFFQNGIIHKLIVLITFISTFNIYILFKKETHSSFYTIFFILTRLLFQ